MVSPIFLANSISEDLISIKDITVRDIISSYETESLYEVITENKSIFDIETIFNKRIKEGKTAYILLISKNKKIKSNSDIVGILTPWDITTLVKNK